MSDRRLLEQQRESICTRLWVRPRQSCSRVVGHAQDIGLVDEDEADRRDLVDHALPTDAVQRRTAREVCRVDSGMVDDQESPTGLSAANKRWFICDRSTSM